jgi:hypothetical protein
MRKLFLAAGLAAAALIPSLASAQTSCEQQRDSHVASTMAGAGLGALVGGAIAGHGNRGEGAVIGAVGGGIVGNAASQPSEDCAHAYGYYDHGGAWHANAIDRGEPDGYYAGYYDRSGAWQNGAPDGYYDNGGRWVAGYAGDGVDHQTGMRRDVDVRESWLEQRIQTATNDGTLSHHDSRAEMRDLNSIRGWEASLRDGRGRLSSEDEAQIQGRLDQLSANLRASLRQS